MNIKKIFQDILNTIADDTDDPNDPGYDPVHVGAMIVLVILALTLLFWLLWALLVFGGGLQAKIIPSLQVLFTSKTAGVFGYIGYPYEMGVFEGWPTNVVALVFVVMFVCAMWYLFNKKEKYKEQEKGIKTDEDKLQQ